MILKGEIAKIYTKRGLFYRGEILEETDTHIYFEDFKTEQKVILNREEISLLITETSSGVSE